jgi:hypothetical protein
MTTATLTAITDRATQIGREDRETYIAEFGESPVVGEVGDWDATGVTEMWRLVGREHDLDAAASHDEHQVARLAYLTALFATDDVA